MHGCEHAAWRVLNFHANCASILFLYLPWIGWMLTKILCFDLFPISLKLQNCHCEKVQCHCLEMKLKDALLKSHWIYPHCFMVAFCLFKILWSIYRFKVINRFQEFVLKCPITCTLSHKWCGNLRSLMQIFSMFIWGGTLNWNHIGKPQASNLIIQIKISRISAATENASIIDLGATASFLP